MDIQEIVAGVGASQALKDAAGKVGLSPDQAQNALQGVLEHVADSQPLESMVESVAAKAGIDASQVQQFLPSVMALLQGHADNASEGVQTTISGILGSLGNSALTQIVGHFDADKDGSVVDEALDAVKGLFGNKA